jgi:predicted dehydrogenase
MIAFALFGAGRIGRMHAENLVRRSDAKLLYVVDSKPEAARALAEPLGAKQATEEQAFADPAVQAVLIATSTGSHADLSIAAAKAGKAIFCEKPVDLTLPKVEKCIAAVKKAGVPMFVGFNRRFDPSFRALKNQLDDGAIGKVEQVIITNRDPGLPEMRFLATSGGLFLDFTIHDFDMARWLLGEEPVEVFARGAVLVDPRVKTEGNDIDTDALAAHRVREDVPDQQHAPGGLRLRPAHRGLRLQGHAARGQPHADHGAALGQRVDVRRQPLAELPDPLCGGLRGRAVVVHPQRRAPQAGRGPARGQPPGPAAVRGRAEVRHQR